MLITENGKMLYNIQFRQLNKIINSIKLKYKLCKCYEKLTISKVNEKHQQLI